MKAFCRDFARLYGCPLRELEADLWRMELTPELQRWARRSGWMLCFHRDLLGAHPDAQLVAPGSPVLTAMKEVLQRTAPVAEERLYPPAPPGRRLPKELSAVDGTLKLESCEVFYRTLARVHFRLSLTGLERHEELFPVVLDAHDLKPADQELERALQAAGPRGDPCPGRDMRVATDPLLKKAFDLAERRTAALVAEAEQRAAQAAAQERKEAEKYFNETIRSETDLLRRQELEAYRQRHLQELEERHRVSADLEVLGVILYRIPHQRCVIRLKTPAAWHRFAVDRDLLSGHLLVGRCRHHRVPLTRVSLCPDHGLGCEKCHWVCPSCRRPRCPDCGKNACRFCPNPHCQACLGTCQACGQSTALAHLSSCASCGDVCLACVLPVGSEIRCRQCATVPTCGHPALKNLVGRCSVSGDTFCAPCSARDLGPCALCRQTCRRQFLTSCSLGGELLCPAHALRLRTGATACPVHSAVCSCGVRWPADRVEPCAFPGHGHRCPDCRWRCSNCLELRCGQCQKVKCPLCPSADVLCQACALPCPICPTIPGAGGQSSRLCPRHSPKCSDCASRACPGHFARCSSCGAELCSRCLGPTGQCLPCRHLAAAPAGEIERHRALLQSRAINPRRYSTRLMARGAGGRTVLRLRGWDEWTLSIRADGQLESCLHRTWLQKLLGMKGVAR
ncbi:MAG TPA: hypothetical protein VNO81_12700 [Candidatus Nitrosotenuis sp.]|nr:hypothetical protein [Candidatus Nitrosotenuis sp.]